MRIYSLFFIALSLLSNAPDAHALSRLEQCKDEARIQAGFLPGEDQNGVCAIRFRGSREGTRTCPGLLVFWEQVCRFEGKSSGQTCCE